MSNFSSYANFGFISLKRGNNPAIGDIFIRVTNQTLVPEYKIAPVQEIAGSRERNIRSIKDRIEFSGGLEMNMEVKQIPNFLVSLYGLPTTQVLTAATAFRHVFEVKDTQEQYSIDMQVANAPWMFRFFGAQVNKFMLESDEKQLKCSVDLMPRKAFITAQVTADVSSGTTLTVDQTTGLVVGDKILVLDQADDFTTKKELTIASVDSETQLTTDTIDVALTTADIVVIKSTATRNYDQDKVVSWLTNTEILTGNDIDNVVTDCKESLTLEYINEVEGRWCNSPTEAGRFSEDIITKGYDGKGQVMKFYDSASNLDKLRKNSKTALRVKMQSDSALEANSAVSASSTWGATANGFKVEATTPGVAGNDINVTIIVNTTDTLEASKSGNNILIKLANTTASNNTGTLIAAAVNALSGVNGTAEGTGAEQFTAAEDNVNLGFRQGTSTDVVGRDASEKSYVQFDNADARMEAYFPSGAEDAIVQEEIPLKFYQDNESGDQSKKWSTRVFVVNGVSAY